MHEQRADIGVVAETIRDLAGRGVPLAQALDAAEWPYPEEALATPYAAATSSCPARAAAAADL